MGLGLYVAVRLSNRELLDRDAVFEGLANLFPAVISDPRLRCFTRVDRQEDGVDVLLHPVEEPVEFRIDAGGRLTCSAKTSSCGPGYHAFLVDCLEAVASWHGWEWTWDGEEGEGDETSYWSERSFTSLQHEMLAFLQKLSKIVTDDGREGHTHLKIAMSANYPSLARNEPFAMTLLGPRDRAWLLNVAQATTAPYWAGAEYFVWWNRDADACFWEKTGRAICWTDLRWTKPVNDEQRFQLFLANRCFEVAKEIDGAAEVPEAEWDEIRTLLSEDDDNHVPAPDQELGRIGYRRHLMRLQLTGGWSLELPGYYYQTTENDGTTLVFWFANRTIRASSLSWEPPKEGCQRKRVTDDAAESIEPDVERLDYRQESPPKVATIRRQCDDDDTYCLLHGSASIEKGECIVSICYSDDADRDWAIQTFRSLRHPSASKDSAE